MRKTGYNGRMPTVLALIPARAGSKALVDKNIRPVAGKPMLVHSIEHAKASALIDRVIVSTDSAAYAEIARKAGADVPFLRPTEISGDHSTDLEAFTHALTWLREHEGTVPDICVQLRPTSPHRDVKDIDAVIQILLDHPEIDSVRSVAKAPAPPFKMWFLGKDNMLEPVVKTSIKDAHNLPRQMLPQAYLQNACIDAVRSSVILEKGSMTGDRIRGYVMEDDFDIDTKADLVRLEAHLKGKKML